MFRLEGGRPGDVRGFLHKSFIGKAVGKVIKTVVPFAGTVGEVVSTGRSLFGRKRAARAVLPRTLTARPSLAGAEGKRLAKELKFGGINGFTPAAQFPLAAIAPPRGKGVGPPQRTPCDFPMVRDREGRCRMPTSGEFGGEQFGVGDAVMGRYGVALEPGVKLIERSVCLKGMTLGDDGLCYNKGAITNKQRQWPRGRQPLLTGGDMRAISIAARAGSKLERTTKRLRSLGMMKALPKGHRAPRAHAHAKPVAAVSV